jgi:hypothetical protein
MKGELEMLKSRRWVLGLVVAGLLLVPALGNCAAGHVALADEQAGMQFSPLHGSADASRLVSFWGFDDGEILDITFTAPDGSQATVAGNPVWYSSAQDDGTGVFGFYPSDWLSPLLNGKWTVNVTGESGGATFTTYFFVGDE